MNRIDSTRLSEDLPAGLAGFSERSNLTNAQFLIWIGQKLSPDIPLYNMVLTFLIKGPIQSDTFVDAFGSLVAHSDALRTVVEEVEGIPQRRALEAFIFEMPVIDLSDEPDAEERLKVQVAEKSRMQFNLSERLFDTALYKLGEHRYVWYLNQHHLITDGWSTAVVYRKMAALYDLAFRGELGSAPPMPAFEDYAAHEKQHVQTAKFQEAADYWRAKLAEPFEATPFYDRRTEGGSTRTERVYLDLGAERSQRLKQIAQEKGIRALTLDMSLLNIFITVLFAFLHRISGTPAPRIGAPFHNRPRPAFRETIGLFIEICLLKVAIAEGESFASLIQKVQLEIGNVIRYAQPGTSSSISNRSYDVLLNYIHASFPDFGGHAVEPEWVHAGHGDSDHKLRLQVHDFGETGNFILAFDLSVDVFDAAERQQLVGHFLKVLDAFIKDREQAIAGIDLVTGEERRKLLIEPNQTQSDYPYEKSIVELFEAQAARTPEEVAAVCGENRLTYLELDERANQLANLLRARGVEKGALVGICMERSLAFVAGVLGILKAGAAYVPLDPSYPVERLRFMLEDMTEGLAGERPILLTQARLVDRLPAEAAQILALDQDWLALEGHASTPPSDRPGPEDLAYVIYTSGSTGKPKGVMIEHRGLTNYLWWARKVYVGDETLDFPLFSSISFDLTVTSLYVPLISGGKTVIYPEDGQAKGLEILRIVEENAVDIIKLTPSHLALLRDYNRKADRVRKLIVGGEDFKTELAQAITDRYDGAIEIYNEYGPTETVVGCMIHRFDPAFDTGTSVSIGKPADNVQIYILDQSGRPVPGGMIGELTIAGDGVGRGYLNRPSLTAERFVPDTFRDTGGRMYRTGDRGRWTNAGTVDFLGRMDYQVKIGGARIELGEVEAALLAHPDILECVVEVSQPQVSEEPAAPPDHCARCGLPANLPSTTFNEDQVCNWCEAFDRYRDQAEAYFGTMEDLKRIFAEGQAERNGGYDALMLLSGGKDSSYVLYQLVEMGLKVLVFSLDNGFISDGAKANIQRVVDDLGLELVWGRTPAMNDIFVDSLNRFSNVCNGCFKTIYTLSMKLARERGIRHIVTGLTRGQIFETRLEEQFRNQIYDVQKIDQTILEARKAYHGMYDAVAKHLDVDIFKDESIFHDIQFVDFFRYSEVGLEEMLAFLDARAPWIRPSDTGRSTNCLINEAGIYVHKRERGFHNYAFPYSWDVRLGHKTRQAAMDELDDDIDVDRVAEMLREIGYDEKVKETHRARAQLAAYYVGKRPIPISELKSFVEQNLPDYMVPSQYTELENMPLTANGKVDRKALPAAGGARPEIDTRYQAPETAVEERLSEFWSAILKIRRIGVHDNFFDIGGTSLPAIQFINRIQQEYQIDFPIQSFFEKPTIAQASEKVEELILKQIEQMSEDEVHELILDLD